MARVDELFGDSADIVVYEPLPEGETGKGSLGGRRGLADRASRTRPGQAADARALTVAMPMGLSRASKSQRRVVPLPRGSSATS